MTTAASLRQSPGMDGPPEPELARIRDVVYRNAGIFYPDNKLQLLQDRCGRRMKERGIPSLREYSHCLTVRPGCHAELVALLNEITIGETCFFRNQPQLDAWLRVVIPHIVQAKSHLAIRRLRIWSAGCSTGEEPYTLRMMMLEDAALKDWSIEVLATDLNERSLAHAQEGLYSKYSTRNLTPFYRSKYFVQQGDKLRLNAQARSHVSFSRLNLSDDSRMTFMKSMDVIFCCNVLIYFDLASKQRVIQHFYHNLLPHGHLFLGHSESLFGVNEDFRLVHLPGTTSYLKGERAPLGGKLL